MTAAGNMVARAMATAAAKVAETVEEVVEGASTPRPAADDDQVRTHRSTRIPAAAAVHGLFRKSSLLFILR